MPLIKSYIITLNGVFIICKNQGKIRQTNDAPRIGEVGLR
jgi:hypothetical protein